MALQNQGWRLEFGTDQDEGFARAPAPRARKPSGQWLPRSRQVARKPRGSTLVQGVPTATPTCELQEQIIFLQGRGHHPRPPAISSKSTVSQSQSKGGRREGTARRGKEWVTPGTRRVGWGVRGDCVYPVVRDQARLKARRLELAAIKSEIEISKN